MFISTASSEDGAKQRVVQFKAEHFGVGATRRLQAPAAQPKVGAANAVPAVGRVPPVATTRSAELPRTTQPIFP